MTHFFSNIVWIYKNTFNFKDRASRSEFWLYFLYFLIVYAVLAGIDYKQDTFDTENGFGGLSGIFMVLNAVPSWSATARRLHDTGKSGWWQLLSFIPLVGPFIVLGMCAPAGQPHDNEYGPAITEAGQRSSTSDINQYRGSTY